jgi:hypothetical protein
MTDDTDDTPLAHPDAIARKAAADIQDAYASHAQAAREAAAMRMRRAQGYAPGQIHTEEKRDAAYKELTGEDRPGSEGRRSR